MLKINKNKIIGWATPVIMLATPAAAMAQAIVPTQLTENPNIVNVVSGLIRVFLLIAFVIAFIMLLVGGLRWIMAGGDEKAVEKARNTITAALIGLVIILVAYALIRIVEVVFRVTIITGTTSVPTLTPGGL